MNSIFSRWLPCATLAAWSAILLMCYGPNFKDASIALRSGDVSGSLPLLLDSTGKIKNLLAPEFHVGVLAASAIMGVMALVFLLFRADASCCSAAQCGHSLSRLATGKVLTFLILLLPISAAAMFSPDGFSANTVRNRGMITDASLLGARRPGPPKPLDLPLPSKDPAPSNTAPDSTSPNQPASPSAPGASASTPPAPTDDYLQRTPEGYIVAEVMDLLYAAQDNALRKDFEGKTVQLIGQLMPDAANNASGKRFKAVRMFMTCCAADARPVATLVESDTKTEMAEMTWVKITGTPTFPLENGRRISVLKADKVEATQPPDASMLY